MPFPPKKKKPADFALLLPEEKPEDALDDAEPDEDGDDMDMDEMAMDMDEGDTDDTDEGGDGSPSIDPEQAALCRTLGFTEPDQQQALLDLIDLRMSGTSTGSEESDALPPLPESTY